MLDDDARELLRYKEMYLADGDLHAEGMGRQRRFHWKNMGLYKMFASSSLKHMQTRAPTHKHTFKFF